MIITIVTKDGTKIFTDINHFEIDSDHDANGDWNEETKFKTISMLGNDGRWLDNVVTDNNFTITIDYKGEK